MKIEIFDISHKGAGVGKADGKIVFVPRTDIGEVVDVEIVKSTIHFDHGKVGKVLQPSPHRCLAFCPHFFECAGCDFQFLEYARELELKGKMLKNELKKVNFLQKIAIFPSKTRFFYRNKIKLTHFEGKLGYHSVMQNLVEIESCPLAEIEINDAIKVVKKYLSQIYYQFLQSVTFRKGDEKVLISFLFSRKENFVYNQILDKYVIGIFQGEILESGKTKLVKVYNQTATYKTIAGYKIPVDFTSFFQINDLVAENLYNLVVEKMSGLKVINAYSGQGVLSLLLSKNCSKVIGIEVQKSSHKIAESLKTKNMENINALVEDALPSLVQNEEFDAIILDPAREGCKKNVIEAIKKAKISKICYISCNFSTLTRDLKLLAEDYEIEEMAIFDMFSNTANIEVFTLLKLNDK